MGKFGRYIAFWILMTTPCWQPVALSQVRAQAVVDPPLVETGDTFQLWVLVAGIENAPAEVDFSAWKPWLPADNRLKDYQWQRSGTQWVRRFTLISFDSLTVELPALIVRLSSGDSVLTNPVQLKVRQTPAGTDLSELVSIRDIHREAEHWTDYWPWAALLLSLIAVFWWYLRRKKTVPVAIALPPPPPPPAYEKALAALEILEQKQLLKKGEVPVFYEMLDKIVRKYLEERFGILATESTTREVLRDLKKTDYPPALRQRLEALLLEADLVKYARIFPSQNNQEQSLKNARQIILGTTPQNTVQTNAS
jgi:hypothetical protein